MIYCIYVFYWHISLRKIIDNSKKLTCSKVVPYGIKEQSKCACHKIGHPPKRGTTTTVNLKTNLKHLVNLLYLEFSTGTLTLCNNLFNTIHIYMIPKKIGILKILGRASLSGNNIS